MEKRLIGLVLAGLLTGCLEYDDTSPLSVAAESNPAVEETNPSQNVPVGADQAEWDAISWKTASGPSAKGARQVMTLDGEIAEDGRIVRFSWDTYPWSGYGLGHFFVWDGSRWVGGKFEWIRTPGQAVKLTHNIREGYNGLRPPAPGTRVAFAWTNASGTERSNLIFTTWR